MMPDVETLERKREEHIISMFQEPKKARGQQIQRTCKYT